MTLTAKILEHFFNFQFSIFNFQFNSYLCSGQCGKICEPYGSRQLATTQKNAKSQSFKTFCIDVAAPLSA